MFHLFAELIAQHLDVIERARGVEQALEAERREAELREQFIAVLGHDLRSPLAGIVSGARVLGRMGLEVSAARTAQLIQASAMRAATLVDNLLDFARGRLGGGVPIARDPEAALKPILQTVIAEQEGAAASKRLIPMADDHLFHAVSHALGYLLGEALADAVGLVEVHLEADGVRPVDAAGDGRDGPRRPEGDARRRADAVFDHAEQVGGVLHGGIVRRPEASRPP